MEPERVKHDGIEYEREWTRKGFPRKQIKKAPLYVEKLLLDDSKWYCLEHNITRDIWYIDGVEVKP